MPQEWPVSVCVSVPEYFNLHDNFGNIWKIKTLYLALYSMNNRY